MPCVWKDRIAEIEPRRIIQVAEVDFNPVATCKGTGAARRDHQPKRETAGTIRVPAVSVQILVERSLTATMVSLSVMV